MDPVCSVAPHIIAMSDRIQKARPRLAASKAALTRDSLRVKVVVQRVRVGGDEYRVISPVAATQLYIAGACNYHVCRVLHDREDADANDWSRFHVEFSPTWSR